MRIAHKLWERATVSGNDLAGEVEAVQRMGNLYAWGERVVMAARGGGVSRERVVDVDVDVNVDVDDDEHTQEGRDEHQRRQQQQQQGRPQQVHGLQHEEVFTVVMAARDLASWLLSEEAKSEIEGLWTDRWVFGGVVCGEPV